MGPDLGRVVIGGGYDVASCCAWREGGREKSEGEKRRKTGEGNRRGRVRLSGDVAHAGTASGLASVWTPP